MKKFLTFALTLALMLGLGITALAAETTKENTPYTLEEMLTILLKDEYNAKAIYEAVVQRHGQVTPFTNLINAEQTHIDSLTALMTAKGIPVPAISVTATSPDTVAEALKAGAEAEVENIKLYEEMLAQDLPDDVRLTFERLMRASQNHLRAFTGANSRGGRAWAQPPAQSTEEAPVDESALAENTEEAAEETPAFVSGQGRGNGANNRGGRFRTQPAAETAPEDAAEEATDNSAFERGQGRRSAQRNANGQGFGKGNRNMSGGHPNCNRNAPGQGRGNRNRPGGQGHGNRNFGKGNNPACPCRPAQ